MKNNLLFKMIGLMSFLFFLSSCGFQSIPQQKNEVESAIAEVTNQYKRRADLIPSIVKTVSAYAKKEQDILVQVTEARAKATSMNIDAKSLTAEKLQEFRKIQGDLSMALGKLLSISENYPQLKSDQGYADLRAQLEGTENRIARARSMYIEAVKQFNNLVTVPPTSWTNSIFYQNEKLPQWDVSEDEKKTIEKPPQVDL